MIHPLHLFVDLDKDKARIVHDVCKRSVGSANSARPLFEVVLTINTRLSVPQLGAITVDLLVSVETYL